MWSPTESTALTGISFTDGERQIVCFVPESESVRSAMDGESIEGIETPANVADDLDCMIGLNDFCVHDCAGVL